MDKITEFIETWSKKKIAKGKSFDDLLQIDGVPLWWFYKWFFRSYVLPIQISTYSYLEKGSVPGPWAACRYALNSELMRAYLRFNEHTKIRSAQRVGKASPRRKVMFLTFPHHLLPNKKVFRIQGIIDKIRSDGKFDDLILYAQPLTKQWDTKIASLPTIYAYCTDEIIAKAARQAEDLHIRWMGIKNKKDLLSVKGESVWPYVRYAFNFFFSKEFLSVLIIYYETIKKIIKEENISAIVLSSAHDLYEKCALAAAKNAKIPILLIQHGLMATDKPDFIGKSRYAVFSELTKKNLVRIGVAKETMVVTGPVVFDGIEKYISQSRRAGRKIVIATAPCIEDMVLSKESYFKIVQKILADLRGIPRIEIVLKLHPREKYKAVYESLIQSLGMKAKVVQVLSREEFFQLVGECDAFINLDYSTSAIEAMILGVPTITIEVRPVSGVFHQILKKHTITRKYTNDISKLVQDVLSGKIDYSRKSAAAVRTLCYKVDGKASERIVNALYKVI